MKRKLIAILMSTVLTMGSFSPVWAEEGIAEQNVFEETDEFEMDDPDSDAEFDTEDDSKTEENNIENTDQDYDIFEDFDLSNDEWDSNEEFTSEDFQEISSEKLEASDFGECGDNARYSIENDVLRISGTGAIKNYGSGSYTPWYSKRLKIKEIIIEEGITEIPQSAFDWFTHVEKVTLPSTLKVIGREAFRENHALKTINIPDGIESIGYATFSQCNALQEIILPESVTTIGEYAFELCTSVTEVVIPENVSKIEHGAFRKCKKLERVLFKGNQPELEDIWSYDSSWGYSGFTKAFYLVSDKTWNLETLPKGSGLVTWKSYCKNGEAPEYECPFEKRTITAPTCTEEGFTFYECSCGNTKKDDIIEPLGHTEVIDEAKPASIAATGLTEGKHCSVCGEILVAQEEILKLTKLDTPILVSASNAANGVQVKWNAVAGAEYYRVFRKTSSSNWKILTDTTDLSYVDTTAASGTAYTYTVRCLNEDRSGYASAYDKTGKSLTCLGQGVISKIANLSTGGLQITWKAVPGAKGYVVYRKDENGSYAVKTTIKNGKNTTYKDTTAKSNGKKYTYAIRAYFGSTKGAYVGKTYYRLGTHTISSVSNNKAGAITVKWNRNSHATGYQVRYKNNSTDKTITIADNTTLNTVISSLKKGQTYNVYVRGYLKADGATYYSAWSAVKTIKITR